MNSEQLKAQFKQMGLLPERILPNDKTTIGNFQFESDRATVYACVDGGPPRWRDVDTVTNGEVDRLYHRVVEGYVRMMHLELRAFREALRGPVREEQDD